MQKIGLILFVLLFVSLAFISCEKEDDPKAVILVVDEFNRPVQGALVELFSRPTNSIREDYKFTNTEGETYHTFMFTSTLDIKVYKEPEGHYPDRYGSGEITLQREETVRDTIKITTQPIED